MTLNPETCLITICCCFHLKLSCSVKRLSKGLCLFIFKTFVTWHCSTCLFMILIYRISTWREPNIYRNCSKCPENTFSTERNMTWGPLTWKWLSVMFSMFLYFFLFSERNLARKLVFPASYLVKMGKHNGQQHSGGLKHTK